MYGDDYVGKMVQSLIGILIVTILITQLPSFVLEYDSSGNSSGEISYKLTDDGFIIPKSKTNIQKLCIERCESKGYEYSRHDEVSTKCWCFNPNFNKVEYHGEVVVNEN